MFKALRRSAFHATNTAAFGTALRVFDTFDVARQNVLAVVTYHRVDDASRTPDLCPALVSATPRQFERQLDMLSDISQLVSMQQVLEACRGENALPARSVLITFDDASQDFAEYAWPALRERSLPATVFVPTSYPNQPERSFWWDRLHLAVWQGQGKQIELPCGTFELGSDQERRKTYRALRDRVKQLPHDAALQLVDAIVEQQRAPTPPPNVLSWDALRDLARQGVTLAPHTQTHPLLTKVSLDQARQEIVGSRDDLRREIGDSPPVFAYPGGAWNAPVAEILRDEGFELAFTVRRGINDLKAANPLSLNRINIGQQTNSHILRAQLMAGWWKHRSEIKQST